jgi:hypothetical protein
VKANPGLRIEQINKELGTTTKDLALPSREARSRRRDRHEGPAAYRSASPAPKHQAELAAAHTARSGTALIAVLLAWTQTGC